MKILFFTIMLILSAHIHVLEAFPQSHGRCPRKYPFVCLKDGQYCERWNGQTGWCRTIYDIKGNASRSCEPIEVDTFGYPDQGYFWPGRKFDRYTL